VHRRRRHHLRGRLLQRRKVRRRLELQRERERGLHGLDEGDLDGDVFPVGVDLQVDQRELALDVDLDAHVLGVEPRLGIEHQLRLVGELRLDQRVDHRQRLQQRVREQRRDRDAVEGDGPLRHRRGRHERLLDRHFEHLAVPALGLRGRPHDPRVQSGGARGHRHRRNERVLGQRRR